ncbi:arylformamidase [Saccharothrix saharensis]|uniref:Arylformamidase n=1 Tax=Saccharothrix saharensis TaxID=571190 RepID=A0A543JQC0_9PSEU|nr:alpha/beta hydrolase [Saccharothrix saharensis]TQM85036.1 arylformamidase [Saccharothrix saharensis]
MSEGGLAAARAGRLDRDYLPGLGVPSVQPYLDRYADRSAAARAELAWRTVPYGADPAERVHFFPAPRPNAPLVVFVHGGYWQLLDEWSSAYGAPGLVASGAAFAAVGYPLAPRARVRGITESVREAVRALVDDAEGLGVDPRRVVLVGHSVGAQLAGMCLVGPDPVPAAGAVLLSGLYELEPLRHTSVGDEVRLSADEVAECGPARHLHAGLPPLVLARGVHEPAGFDAQQRLAAGRAAALGVPVTELVVPDRNHFDLPLGLGDPDDPVGGAVHALAFATP